MTRFEFLKKLPKQYIWLWRNRPDLLDNLLPKAKQKWNLNLCKESALDYETRNEWKKNSLKAYNAAVKNKWLEECCKHMQQKLAYRTIELCKKDALKYKTRSEWKKNNCPAYDAARKNNWLEECCKHMIKVKRNNKGQK